MAGAEGIRAQSSPSSSVRGPDMKRAGDWARGCDRARTAEQTQSVLRLVHRSVSGATLVCERRDPPRRSGAKDALASRWLNLLAEKSHHGARGPSQHDSLPCLSHPAARAFDAICCAGLRDRPPGGSPPRPARNLAPNSPGDRGTPSYVGEQCRLEAPLYRHRRLAPLGPGSVSGRRGGLAGHLQGQRRRR
jgi:hypothetical protein